MEVTYQGDHKYAALAMESLKELKDSHTNYQTAPSLFYTLTNGVKLHIIAYHTPKSGVKIRCWER